jgi:hypothetical protein
MVFKKKIRRRSRAVSTVRRHFSSRGGVRGIMGSFMPMIAGGVGQIAASVGNSFLPTWGGIGGLAGVGYFMKNDTLMTIAGMHAAAQFPIASLIGGSSSNGGGAI